MFITETRFVFLGVGTEISYMFGRALFLKELSCFLIQRNKRNHRAVWFFTRDIYPLVARMPSGTRVASSLLSPPEWLCLIKMICRVLSLTLTYSRLWRDFRFFPPPQKKNEDEESLKTCSSAFISCSCKRRFGTLAARLRLVRLVGTGTVWTWPACVFMVDVSTVRMQSGYARMLLARTTLSDSGLRTGSIDMYVCTRTVHSI